LTTANLFFATCAKGVEDLLQNELDQLDIPHIKLHTGGVSFGGGIESAYKACLWSRVASRILLQLKEFTIESDHDLYDEIMSIDWSAHFSEDDTLAIDCFSSHSIVSNSHFATLRVKDAVVDQFVQNTEYRPSIDKDNPDIRINVYLSDRQCLAYLDLSGEALHKRGYRLSAGSAPLRETLAAAMLYRAKWESFYEKGLPFYDPMCGSGTLLIEAAMMAADIAPGLLRQKFGFHRWKQYDPQQWEAIRDEAKQRSQKGRRSLPVICGSDNDEKLIEVARKNINNAGLSTVIKTFVQDATDNLLPCTEEKGLIVTNPPYGKRIGQVQLLRILYHRFGVQLKTHFEGWTAVIITSEADLAKSIGLRAFHKNTLYNGALKSVLYQYRINASHDKSIVAEVDADFDTTIRGRIVDDELASSMVESGSAVSSTAASEHASMFTNRLKKNYKHLKKWAKKNNVSCYRVYDADIPQYAVAIDKYEQWVHVQEYQAPKTVDKNRAFQRINDVIDVVADILEIKQDNVVLKTRKKQAGLAQYEKQDQKNHKMTVAENGLKFIVNMYDYIDTGLFLDHRNTRQLIRKLARDRSFLNLFAYTGSVTVYAAAGGAKTTTTVDMSNTYINWAKENLAINGYSAEQHRFIRDDCLSWLKQAVAESQKYELIFVDPPTFSNSKKMSTSLDIVRDHAELLNDCLRLLTDDGQIIFSTNARNFKMDSSLFENCFVKEITTMTTTEDFRRKPLHRCWCLARQESALDI
jgi:23S rRNA (guanine2445-N2)-methyltransferase / 23S rRNA (guanine2069-N7)-methyltransferase